MMRKVIQIADSTQLISLPRKWAIQHGIKKGDELSVNILGSKLFIDTENQPIFEKVEVNVSKLDRTSIIMLVRALYKKGFDEIKLIYDKQIAHHYRTNRDININTVIHEETARCPGLEIIEERENYCVLKTISSADPKEFDNILRRTFILLSDTSKDLVSACKNNDASLLKSIEQKHDNVTRFINHSCRLINKRQDVNPKNTYFLFNIISILDKILDIIKNSARDMEKYQKKVSAETAKLLDLILMSFEFFHELFYKFNLEKVHKINEYKELIHKEILEKTKNIPKEEILLLYELHNSLELYKALTEARIAIEY